MKKTVLHNTLDEDQFVNVGSNSQSAQSSNIFDIVYTMAVILEGDASRLKQL